MENVKYLRDMSKEELTKVFKANDKLQHEVYDDMVDSELYWASEHLDCFKSALSDWSIGNYGHNYIKVNMSNMRDFVEGVMNVQQDYCFLADSENDFVGEVTAKVEAYYDADCYSEDYEKLEEEAEELVKELAEKLVAEFNRTFSCLLKSETQLGYFLEFYAHERLDGDEYIVVDRGDFKLYKEVTYTKKYA